ncbi:iron chelate uptake ABC transporter family permease subunit [Rubrobacter marinus]|uniref:Iron chelate uptake ABC transporter family permease subunit n=1 Tax=Rubrobacter marinus TaxID=2653852 RepID=A0A6G8PZQ1_9ACTN|nr:iron ABC transporter permease [Rubrobacter marinus]QIN79660.1 iron chelate uptake ABC transporter family permease subunit [Rubrobacter marinus]
MRGRVTVRPAGGRFSLRLDLRAVAALVAIGGVALAGAVANVGYGEYPIAPLDVVRTVLGMETGDASSSFIVNTLRLPRALVALLVGAALAVSGAILQGLTRNDLAAPDIIGINAGAGLAAVALIVVLPSVPAAFVPPAAFVGALAVAALLYAIAWRGDGSPVRLILVGVGLSAVAVSLTTLVITFGEIRQVSQALVWLTGSVYGRSWEQAWSLLPWLAVFVPLALARAPRLNALNLGDEVARGLGVRVERERGLLVLTSVALAASAVATAGTIAFVGLMAPHIARRLAGPSFGGLLPVTAVTGAALVVLSDLLGRVLLPPTEIPCGIVTSIVGAPFFLYLLFRGRKG